MRILVVEDEMQLAKVLCETLEEEGFSVDLAADGASALERAVHVEYDAVVLDLMLPKLDGYAVLERLRAERRTPVLILTARDALADKVRGLNAGADDYLTKPFLLEELLARLRALIRRAAQQPTPRIRLGEVEVDLVARRVTRAGGEVVLSAKEFALLELLALNRGRVVTRRMIFDHIYDEFQDTASNVIEVYVASLRRKLGADLIQTRRGQGYLIDV